MVIEETFTQLFIPLSLFNLSGYRDIQWGISQQLLEMGICFPFQVKDQFCILYRSSIEDDDKDEEWQLAKEFASSQQIEIIAA